MPLLIEEVELVVKCLVYDQKVDEDSALCFTCHNTHICTIYDICSKLEEHKIRDETYYVLEPNNCYPINALTQVIGSHHPHTYFSVFLQILFIPYVVLVVNTTTVPC